MEEIKACIAAIDYILTSAHAGRLAPQAAIESAYLQLRMICELIALGCLAVHNDIEATKSGKLRKEWSASKLMDRLEKLHPDFYPRPSKQIIDSEGKPSQIEPITSGYLTKDELKTLNGECGNFLHRGTLKSILSGSAKRASKFNTILNWKTKIMTLLNHHQISVIHSDYEYWVGMSEKTTGRVFWAEMKKFPNPDYT